MKKLLVVVGICVLFIGMPVGMSDCGCDVSSDVTSAVSTEPWLSDADIAAMQARISRQPGSVRRLPADVPRESDGAL